MLLSASACTRMNKVIKYGVALVAVHFRSVLFCVHMDEQQVTDYAIFLQMSLD